MTNYTWIKLYSKDKKSLEQFKEFVTNLNNKWKNTTFSIKDKKKKRQILTILKSPHVNKKAQTQYQSIIYSTNIKCLALDVKKNYILLKKIKNHLFPDVKIKIEQVVFDKKAKFLKNHTFSPKKIYYYKKTKTKKIILEKTLHFLKVLDNYGSLY